MVFVKICENVKIVHWIRIGYWRSGWGGIEQGQVYFKANSVMCESSNFHFFSCNECILIGFHLVRSVSYLQPTRGYLNWKASSLHWKLLMHWPTWKSFCPTLPDGTKVVLIAVVAVIRMFKQLSNITSVNRYTYQILPIIINCSGDRR